MQCYAEIHSEHATAKVSGHDPATNPEIAVELLYGQGYGSSFRLLMSAVEARALATELALAVAEVNAELEAVS